MELLSKKISQPKNEPVKVLQFGEGNFLRGFVDYMIDKANEKGLFQGSVVVLKPIEYGDLSQFHKQEFQYTLSLRGKEDGETKVENRIITCISDAVDVMKEYDKYRGYGELDSLRFVISNTTEAGIVFDENDRFESTPPMTFPGKLTKLLFERFEYCSGDRSKGFIIIPCELIENNGKELKRCVSRFTELWDLGDEFFQWVEESCVFCTTLVDRIVTGYPKEEAVQMFEKFGYEDYLLDTGELFALWVIESEKDLTEELPLHKAGLPVVFTDNLKPYRDRKVRILNGAHTSFSAASFLAGNRFVLESMQDDTIRTFIQHVIYDEVIQTLTLPEEELKEFAASVIERFENPFIKHELLSICLNSISKWKARCLPSFLEYVQKNQQIPKGLCFSLAALMEFYSGSKQEDGSFAGSCGNENYKILDDQKVIDFFANHSKKEVKDFVTAFITEVDFFGEELGNINGVTDQVADYLTSIKEKGMRTALTELIEQGWE